MLNPVIISLQNHSRSIKLLHLNYWDWKRFKLLMRCFLCETYTNEQEPTHLHVYSTIWQMKGKNKMTNHAAFLNLHKSIKILQKWLSYTTDKNKPESANIKFLILVLKINRCVSIINPLPLLHTAQTGVRESSNFP